MELQQENKFRKSSTIQWEDDDKGFEEKAENVKERQEFLDLLNQSDDKGSGLNIREGSIVKGNVVRISDDYVFVDIGHKSEGEIPIVEFKKSGEDGPTLCVEVGSVVEVYLDRFEDENGEMVLSFERAEILKAWDRIEKAYENNEIVEGTILARIKGGLAVDIGVKSFLPGSQVDLRPVRNLDKLLGTKLQFKIIKFNKKRGNIVLSRRALLEQDREKLKTLTMDNIKEGAKIKGIIKNITDYGAFVDLGGIDGLLHITDMSWGRISHPSEIFDVGQEINVIILSYNEEKQRVSLGFKQLLEDPWEKAKDKFTVGARSNGRVVSLTDYGAFVELEDGVEGLIHVSEMSWSKRVKHPSKIVQIGDEVEVLILSVDHDNRKISLGMKQIEPNPWNVVLEKYHVGDVISGTIRNITDFGVFVGIEDGVDGLIHISDLSWTERVKHPADMFKKGDQVEAKILQIDPEAERFSLGIKQLADDPFVVAAEEFKPGTKSSGKATKITDFGVFVELKQGVEGLIHISELDTKEGVKASEIVKEGDSVDFVVLASDLDERKFTLSRKAFQQNLDGTQLQEYIGSVAEPKTVFAQAFSQAKLSGTDTEDK